MKKYYLSTLLALSASLAQAQTSCWPRPEPKERTVALDRAARRSARLQANGLLHVGYPAAPKTLAHLQSTTTNPPSIYFGPAGEVVPRQLPIVAVRRRVWLPGQDPYFLSRP